jgi:hypothetical protein
VIVLETSYLVPSVGMVLGVLLYIGVLVVWPAIEAAQRGRVVWVVLIVLLSPVVGIAWWAVGRWLHDPRQVSV